jgi:Fe2+ transport system protein FeoA
MRCPLCGYEFDSTLLSCHSSCAFNEACGIICCPNCGYQMADEQKSRIATILRRLLTPKQETDEVSPIRAVSHMKPGQSGKIVNIRSKNHARVERLNTLGLIENARLILEQTQPAYVLRIGFTEVSIEQDVANDILVEVG